MGFYIRPPQIDFMVPLMLPLHGRPTFEKTKLLKDSEYPSKFTCRIFSESGSGTGVIIANRESSIIVKNHKIKMLV